MAAAASHEQQQAGAAAAASTSSPPPPRLRVIDTAIVLPCPSPPGPAPLECSLPLTFYDVTWLHTPPVERLFLYRLAPDADVPAILSNLKDSLSRAVRVFYPLAGRLRLTPGTSNRYELHYRPAHDGGVSFTVAEYGGGGGGADDDIVDIDRLATDDPREVALIAPLVPPLPAGGAVLAVQATLLLPAARRGLAVGVAVHHAACDGSGSTHFLHTWAAAARSLAESPPPPPVIDRSLVPDPTGLYEQYLRAAPTADEMEAVKPPAGQLLATFTLCKDDLQRVKDAVASEAARRGVDLPPRCTSLVATLGFVWSCLQRAATEPPPGGARTCLLFPVDHRARLRPPLPDKYLGNCVGPAICVARRDELAAAGARGLFTACAAVAAAIDEAVSDVGASSMDRVRVVLRETTGGGMLTVAGSPRFRVYEVDLGFGRPAKVDIVSVAKTGALALAETRHGAGGMEVGISLLQDGMDRFNKCFAHAIAGLHSHS